MPRASRKLKRPAAVPIKKAGRVKVTKATAPSKSRHGLAAPLAAEKEIAGRLGLWGGGVVQALQAIRNAQVKSKEKQRALELELKMRFDPEKGATLVRAR